MDPRDRIDGSTAHDSLLALAGQRSSVIGKLLASALLLHAAPVPGADPSRLQPVHEPRPEFPPALQNESINDGHALVACLVDDHGSVLDVWSLESSHAAFANSAEESLRKWRFATGSATNAPAAPWPRMEAVRFDFRRSGQITTKTQIDAVKSAFPPQSPPAAKPDGLPTLPADRLKRLSGKEPVAPASTEAGDVVVEFLVDRSGTVRLPVAVSATHRSQAKAAVLSVLHWRFQPLPRDVAAPAVRQRLKFTFPSTRTGESL